MAYHTESLKETNVYGTISSPDVRSFHCRHGTLAKIIQRGRVDVIVDVEEEDLVNHRRTASMNGQASRHCGASRMTEVDGQSSQQLHLLKYPGCHGY